MSRLEAAVKRLAAPIVLEGKQATIHGGGVLAIARWAVKTAMTYQVALAMRQGVFTPEEMRRMAKRQEIPPRCRVWVRSVPGPMQLVATQYRGLFLADGQDVEQLSLRDNLAVMLIGMPGLVLVVGVAPTAEEAWMIEALVPFEFGTGRAPQIWPEPGQIDLPGDMVAQDQFDPTTLFDGIDAMGQLEHPQLTDLDADELAGLLRSQSTPSQSLQKMIDAFSADCEADEPSPELSDALSLLAGAQLLPEQLGQLFQAAMTMFEKHAETRPGLVCHRLNNLGSLFSAAEAYPACVVLMFACVSHPGGGYGQRADAWERAGHAAWQIAAFGLAAEAYGTQLELEPESVLGRFNLAESAFRSGDFSGAADLLEGLSEEGRTETLKDTLACLEITLELVLQGLGLAYWEGFGGPNSEEIIQMVVNADAPSFDVAHRFSKELLERVQGLTDATIGDLAIAKAYLMEGVENWVMAAAEILDSRPKHVALLSVLRKGNSFGEEFKESLAQELDRRGTARTLPDGSDALRYVTSHAYSRHPRTRYFTDEANQIVDTM